MLFCAFMHLHCSIRFLQLLLCMFEASHSFIQCLAGGGGGQFALPPVCLKMKRLIVATCTLVPETGALYIGLRMKRHFVKT